MNNRLLIILGICAVVVIGLAIAVSSGILHVPGITKEDNKIDIGDFDYTKIITANNLPDNYTDDSDIVIDYIYGKVDSPVVLVEWLNFQCSACYSLSPSMREIESSYSDRVAFVQRYLHLSQGHANGLAASVAAEAAARQGKFHEMGDLLYINQPEWGVATTATREDVFAKYAESLGLDMDKWHEDYQNYNKNGIKTRLDFQSNLGIKNGVNGTPYILINSVKITSTKDDIIKALDDALAQSSE
jgi:protein-disulfide isomerase